MIVITKCDLPDLDIEEIAERNPEAIVRIHVDPLVGLLPYQVRELNFFAGCHSARNGFFALGIEVI